MAPHNGSSATDFPINHADKVRVYPEMVQLPSLNEWDLKLQEKLLSAEFMRLVVTPATQACSRLLGFSNFLVSIVEISLCHIMKCKKEVDFSVS